MAEQKTGRAYAFFDCNVSRERIEEAMPKIRQYASSPSELELSLHEGLDKVEMDARLKWTITTRPGDFRLLHSGVAVDTPESRYLHEMRYAIVAKYPSQSNEKTAAELGDVLNQVYRLNSQDNPIPGQLVFRGAVLYEKGGKYHLSK
jgi:hypothetical protein